MPGDVDLPIQLPTSPQRVADRLRRQGLFIRSVWFPSRTDLLHWDQSGCPIYVRQITEVDFEIGPHLENMWASVFSPVFAIHLLSTPNGAKIELKRRFPRVTTTILYAWLVLVIGWGLGIAFGTTQSAAPFWLIILLATLSAPAVGWSWGGQALDAGIPWLIEVLLAPDEEEDW